MNKNYQKYFSQDLAQQLRSNSSLIFSYSRFPHITDEEILCANMFISIFIAGDRFECNSYDISKYVDVSKFVAERYPQLRKLIPYYCKVFNFFRNYAWKQMFGDCSDIRERSFLVQKFFEWLRFVSNIVSGQAFVAPDDSSICNQQVKDDVENGSFTLLPFVKAYLHLSKDNDVIVLPKSMRIKKLNGLSIDDLLKGGNTFFNQCAANIEESIAEIEKMLDEEND